MTALHTDDHVAAPLAPGDRGDGVFSLTDAIDLAMRLHKAGDLTGAERLYRGVLQLAPDMPAALHFLGLLLNTRGQATGLPMIRRSLELSPDEIGWWGNLAEALVLQGRDEEAEEAYFRGVAVDPGNAAIYPRLEAFLIARGRIADLVRLHAEHVLASAERRSHAELGRANARLGRMAAAADHFRAWLGQEPESPVAQHMLRAATGDAQERADDAYVATAFDSYAERFDEHIKSLDYRGPALMAAALSECLGAPKGDLDLLDAGCGTGLCAEAARPFARRLEGVDLSDGMLAKARSLGLYDELTHAELTAFLSARSGQDDVIISGDTLCYFGALGPVMAAAHGALRPGGRFIFTLEADEDCHDFQIGGSGRYQHRSSYVAKAAEAAHFRVDLMRPEKLRDEGGKPMAGLLVALRRM